MTGWMNLSGPQSTGGETTVYKDAVSAVIQCRAMKYGLEITGSFPVYPQEEHRFLELVVNVM